MENQDYKLFTLNENDIQMIIEGLEQLKSKGLTGELMGLMFEGLIRPKDTDPPEAHKKWEKHKKEEEIKKQRKDAERNKLKQRIEVLKAKITLMQEIRAQKDLEFELKKPGRQIS